MSRLLFQQENAEKLHGLEQENVKVYAFEKSTSEV